MFSVVVLLVLNVYVKRIFFKHVKCISKFMHFFGSVNGALVNSEDPDKMPKYVRHLVGLLS